MANTETPVNESPLIAALRQVREELSKLHQNNSNTSDASFSIAYQNILDRLDYLEEGIQHSVELYAFVRRIKEMNLAFQPITCYNTVPTSLGAGRIKEFVPIVIKEVEELNKAISTYPAMPGPNEPYIIDLGQVADCLGDLAVFVFSEAARWGIPLIHVLKIIMDSQASKLVDGKPIPHPTEPGKFGKGPNFFPPEDAIRSLLNQYTLIHEELKDPTKHW